MLVLASGGVVGYLHRTGCADQGPYVTVWCRMGQVYRVNPDRITVQPADRWDSDTRGSTSCLSVRMPRLRPGCRVVALGSCFAQHLIDVLCKVGVTVNDHGSLFYYADEIVNTFTLSEHFQWALCEDDSRPNFLFDGASRYCSHIQDAASARAGVHDTLLAADCVVLTLGLSEVWRRRDTGRVAWHRPDDTSEHVFSVATVQENTDNLRDVVRLIRAHCQPECAVVLTVSPVPLNATFRDMPVQVADTFSKARLLAAVDGLLTELADPNVFYWPAYDYVTRQEDAWEPDGRHPKMPVIRQVMDEFIRLTGVTMSGVA